MSKLNERLIRGREWHIQMEVEGSDSKHQTLLRKLLKVQRLAEG